MIIGISGKKQSGKDTIGKIIQYLTTYPNSNGTTDGSKVNRSYNSFIMDMGMGFEPKWQIKQFAEKVKQIVCLLLGCSMEQLEDNDFKEKELGREWDKYRLMYFTRDRLSFSHDIEFHCEYYNSEEEAISATKENLEIDESSIVISLIKLTPRKLLQLIGTDCGRDIIHPNIWVNATMNDYKSIGKNGYVKYGIAENGDRIPIGHNSFIEYPNWIITDVRFPNELKAIEDRGGIVIRIERPFEQRVKQYDRTCLDCKKGFNYKEIKDTTAKSFYKVDVCPYCNSMNHSVVLYKEDKHESEIALDNHKFNYTIINDGTIDQLISQVKIILETLKII